MKVTKINIVTFLLMCGTFLSAQQEPLFQHNYINPYIYNPAYSGISNNIDIALIRTQKWTDYNGGFVANLLTLSTPIKSSNSSWGLRLNADQVGITNKIKAHLSYGYKINLGKDMILQPALSFGAVDQSIDFSNIVTVELDPIFTNGFASKKTGLDASFGLFYKYKSFHLGFAVPQLLNSRLEFSESNLFGYELERQFIINSGYKFKFGSDRNSFFQPDLIAIQTPGLPFQYSASLLTGIDKIGWIGATYKSDYALGVNLGLSFIKNLKIGLAYDIKIGEIASISNANNFEIGLFYSIGRKKDLPMSNADNMHDTIKEKVPDIVEIEKTIDTTTFEEPEFVEPEIIETVTEVEPEVIEPEIIDTINEVEPEIIETVTEVEPEIIETVTEVEPEIIEETNTNSTSISNSSPTEQTKSIKAKDDYFVELAKESPSLNGYYVVLGPYLSQDKASEVSQIAKNKFSSSRVIKNQGNGQYYVTLYYSPDINGVIEILMLARDTKQEEITKAWVLNYFKKG